MDSAFMTTAMTLALEFITMEMQRLENYAAECDLYVVVDIQSGHPYFLNQQTNTMTLSNSVCRADFFSRFGATEKQKSLSSSKVMTSGVFIIEAYDHLAKEKQRMLAALATSKETASE